MHPNLCLRRKSKSRTSRDGTHTIRTLYRRAPTLIPYMGLASQTMVEIDNGHYSQGHGRRHGSQDRCRRNATRACPHTGRERERTRPSFLCAEQRGPVDPQIHVRLIVCIPYVRYMWLDSPGVTRIPNDPAEAEAAVQNWIWSAPPSKPSTP